jgi:hypothetical protein
MSEYVEPWLKLFRWTKPTVPTAFDTNMNCVAMLPAMKQRGFTTAIRYYDHTVRQKKPDAKCLGVDEAQQIMAAGFDIVTVFEVTNEVKHLTAGSGLAHGRLAGWYASSVIHQPMGSAIYFAVDQDLFPKDLKAALKDHILPYFKAVVAGMKEKCLGGIPYRVGVYGPGAVCAAVLDAGLAKYAWLWAGSGTLGYADFEASGRWHLKQGKQIDVRGNRKTGQPMLHYDPNFVGAADIGQFSSRDIFP